MRQYPSEMIKTIVTIVQTTMVSGFTANSMAKLHTTQAFQLPMSTDGISEGTSPNLRYCSFILYLFTIWSTINSPILGIRLPIRSHLVHVHLFRYGIIVPVHNLLEGGYSDDRSPDCVHVGHVFQQVLLDEVKSITCQFLKVNKLSFHLKLS